MWSKSESAKRLSCALRFDVTREKVGTMGLLRNLSWFRKSPVTRRPILSGHDVIAALTRKGFVVARERGNHRFLRHADGRRMVVPVFPDESMSSGLLVKILRECGMTEKEFLSLLR
jgi:predicted RNA binding protein YcfA (HicA-like mRNA interferase family)